MGDSTGLFDMGSVDAALVSTALALVSASLAIAVYAGIRRWSERRRRQRTARTAQLGERRAAYLLGRAGYRIVEEQPQARWVIARDGIPLAVKLSADYLVERRGKTWVAEVKTGQLVANLRHGPTRRQLLEYQLAFDCEGVLLVDVELSKVVHVGFPGVALSDAPRRFGLRALAAAAMLGASLSLVVVHIGAW